MKRILLTVAYDGTGYSGFQAQKSGVPTIESELNRAITELTGTPAEVSGASRTDAGVHALCNLAVFDTESRIPPGKFANALNVRLPDQICVQDSREVPADFHPRFCDTVKTYDYVIYNARFASPRKRRFSFYSYTPYDVEKMRQAAQFLVGEHDFKSFCSVHTQALTTTRTITGVEVIERPCEEERVAECVADGVKIENAETAGAIADSREPAAASNVADRGSDKKEKAYRGVSPREIIIRVSGTGFLYNMVRIIAGTLMEVGRGAMAPEQVKEILEARDREKAGPTAPPEGLTLVKYQILDPKDDRSPGTAEQMPDQGTDAGPRCAEFVKMTT